MVLYGRFRASIRPGRTLSYSRAIRGAALAGVGVGSTIFSLNYFTPPSRNDTTATGRPETPFTAFLPSRHPPYDPFAKKALNPISVEQAESFLYANQRSLNWHAQGGPILRHDFNTVASNVPCEDDAAYAYLDGRHYFSVYDGHGGWKMSRYLAEHLISRVANGLADGTVSSDADVHAAIKHAFLQLDHELVHAPFPLSKANNTAARVRNFHAWELATSGSCALMAICDAKRDRLHVAVTGDSRAVMGTWQPSAEPGGRGVWLARVLSEDQTSANPKEAKRLQALHPPDEAKALVRNGRMLDLGVSRAFGDARFKWSIDGLKNISTTVFGRAVAPYKDYKTPPYLTAEPDVVSVPLTPEHGRGFIVLASDGVWDRLTNTEVVGLVGGWLDGLQGSHTREDVTKLTLLADHPPETYFPKCWFASKAKPTEKWSFTFQDPNIATHVIRNGVAGDDNEELRYQYSFSDSRSSRRERDDMTVTVILLGRSQVAVQPSRTQVN